MKDADALTGQQTVSVIQASAVSMG